MSCASCNNTGFVPVDDTWTKQSSLGYASWQPYPELSAPAKKENYDGSGGYLYAQNTCNPSMAGPPTTNGYNITDRQLPNKEGYEKCDQWAGNYKTGSQTTWLPQPKYTL